jgi:hypothetical protein
MQVCRLRLTQVSETTPNIAQSRNSLLSKAFQEGNQPTLSLN